MVHIIPALHEEAAGPSYSVPKLCESISRNGVEVLLKSMSASTLSGNVKAIQYDHFKMIFPSFGISTSLVRSLVQDAKIVDVIHNHSLWSMINISAGFVATGKKAKFVVSPRGTLSPWALNHSKMKKKVFSPLQMLALRRADLIHATSYMEYCEIRDNGFTNPVAIVPNGVDIPNAVHKRNCDYRPKKTLLFLSRIHEKKGIEELLAAWKILQNNNANWHLKIVGKGKTSYVNRLKDLAIQLELERYEISGPIYGHEKSQVYFESDLFVLPSKSENFGMVVAEALAHSVPVVTTKGTPWSTLPKNNCGWWVQTTLEDLTAALREAMDSGSTRLNDMGENGRRLMETQFSWGAIGYEMFSCYNWLTGRAEAPDCILFD